MKGTSGADLAEKSGEDGKGFDFREKKCQVRIQSVLKLFFRAVT